jgi:hypothetical protein
LNAPDTLALHGQAMTSKTLCQVNSRTLFDMAIETCLIPAINAHEKRKKNSQVVLCGKTIKL